MAEEKKDKVEAESKGASSAPAPGGGSKLPLILALVNTLASVGIVALLVMNFKKENSGPKPEHIVAEEASHGEAKAGEQSGGHGDAKKPEGGHGEAKSGHGGDAHGEGGGQDFGKMIVLEQFTVNLSTTGSASAKFARVNISLEVKSPDTETEVTSKMPRVRNVIIDLFNSKRPTDLATPEGRNFLKDEIQNALNGFLITGKINGVFFTNFALSS